MDCVHPVCTWYPPASVQRVRSARVTRVSHCPNLKENSVINDSEGSIFSSQAEGILVTGKVGHGGSCKRSSQETVEKVV